MDAVSEVRRATDSDLYALAHHRVAMFRERRFRISAMRLPPASTSPGSLILQANPRWLSLEPAFNYDVSCPALTMTARQSLGGVKGSFSTCTSSPTTGGAASHVS
jgi:hypothetical protein